MTAWPPANNAFEVGCLLVFAYICTEKDFIQL